MKLAYLVNQYPKVSHSFIRREIRALEDMGIHVERIALRGWDAELADPADELERARTRYVLRQGLPALVPPLVRAAAASPRRFLSALRLALKMSERGDRPWPYHVAYFAEACRVLRWLRAAEVGHVHAHFGTNAAEVAMLVDALGGPRYSFTVHGPEEFDKPQPLRLDEKVCRSVFVVAVSAFGRSQLYRWLPPTQWPKVKVVPCGFEPEFAKVDGRPIPAAPRLVCVGRLCEQKGQLMLLSAAADLKAQGVAFKLVLAGDGDLRAEVERQIERLGLKSDVTITGWIGGDRVREEILAARAVVLPSFAEGLPVALMEAMALRRPVVATYVAGIPELVRNGVDGWLVPAGDREALSAALREVLAFPVGRLAAMGDSGRARVLERHSIDRAATALADLFASPRPCSLAY